MADPEPKATDTKPAEQGSPFWRFSLRLYRQPGVGDACIALQEQAGVDVNVLLFLLWQATEGRGLWADDVAAIEARVGPWREATVVPLRAVRRALKTPPDLCAGPTAEAFRTRIKAVELEAERMQQEAMFAIAQSLEPRLAASARQGLSVLDDARTNVEAYQGMLGTVFPQDAVDVVLKAFAALHAPEA